MQLVLASQSPYRKAQLTSFGLKFLTESPLVDEDKLKNFGPTDLVELSRFLAQKKAESLKNKHSQAIVIGGDQIAELDGQRLDKPRTRERAREMLKAMSGRTHRLITSLSLVSPLKTFTLTDITHITFRELSDSIIDAYIVQDRALDCAGGYKIESGGLALIEKIEGSDPSAIQGVPLIALTRGLSELGIEIENLWSSK